MNRVFTALFHVMTGVTKDTYTQTDPGTMRSHSCDMCTILQMKHHDQHEAKSDSTRYPTKHQQVHAQALSNYSKKRMERISATNLRVNPTPRKMNRFSQSYTQTAIDCCYASRKPMKTRIMRPHPPGEIHLVDVSLQSPLWFSPPPGSPALSRSFIIYNWPSRLRSLLKNEALQFQYRHQLSPPSKCSFTSRRMLER